MSMTYSKCLKLETKHTFASTEITESEHFHEGGKYIFKMVSDFFLVIKTETYSRLQGNLVSLDTRGRQEFI